MLVVKTNLLKKIALFASKDESKAAICGLYVDGCNIVATDSYRLGVLECDGEPLGESFIIPADVVKSLPAGKYAALAPDAIHIYGMPANVKPSGVPDCADAEQLKLCPKVAELSYKPTEGNYPKWERALPKMDKVDEKGGAAFYGADAGYIADAMALLKEVTSSTPGRAVVFFTPEKRNKPIVMERRNDDIKATALVMPMRL